MTAPLPDLGRRTLLMGIVNVTPDSFYDGGRHATVDAAVAHGRKLAEEGADILDIGGESTRPGASPVSAEAEQARILPVIAKLAGAQTPPISVDTWRAETAEKALKAGARILNDVRGFLGGPDIARVAAAHDAPSVLMHWESHDQDPRADILDVVRRGLARSVEAALAAGLKQARIMLDPGVGFGKTPAQNLLLMKSTQALKSEFGLPVLIGASRKRMISHLLGGREPEARLPGALALHVGAVLAGADLIRAHDVAQTRDALRIADAWKAAR